MKVPSLHRMNNKYTPDGVILRRGGAYGEAAEKVSVIFFTCHCCQVNLFQI